MTLRWLGAAFWCTLGALIAWQSHAHGLGNFAEPGPGMIAFGLGLAMLAVGAGRVLAPGRRLLAEPAAARPFPRRQVALCAVLTAYFLLLVPAGYLLSTFALLLVLMAGFSGVRPPLALALAAVGAGATYAVFKLGLGVQLPAGLLG